MDDILKLSDELTVNTPTTKGQEPQNSKKGEEGDARQLADTADKLVLQEQEQQSERIKQNIKMENDRNRVISHVNNKTSTKKEKKIERKNISRKHSKNENSKVDARKPPSGVKHEEVDHPPSVCAAWLGHTIKIVKKSKEAHVLKAAISTAG